MPGYPFLHGRESAGCDAHHTRREWLPGPAGYDRREEIAALREEVRSLRSPAEAGKTTVIPVRKRAA
jgi:hypothetical protein